MTPDPVQQAALVPPEDEAPVSLRGYVDEVVRAEARDLVRRFFGVGDPVPFAWARRPSTDGKLALHVRIGEGADALELDIAAPDRFAWFRGRTFSAAYRRRSDGTDPSADPATAALLDGLRGRLRRLDLAESWVKVSQSLEREARFAGIGDHMYRQVSPRQAVVRLGFRCNQRCEFCWQDRDWPEPPAHYYDEWVDAIAAAGRTRITFTGGEPTIHPSFLALVRRATKLGLWVDVQTNAVRTARDGFAAELRDAGVRSLFISFHSHITEVSDDMTNARGTHVRTVEGIGRALDAGLYVELNCVVERRNAAHLADHAAFIVEHFGPGKRATSIGKVEYSHPSSYYDRSAWARRVAPLDEVKPQLRAAMATLAAAGVAVSAIGTCGFPPCVVGDTADTLRKMDRTIEEANDVSGRTFVDACGACAQRPHCLGLRKEYVEVFGDRGIQPLMALD